MRKPRAPGRDRLFIYVTKHRAQVQQKLENYSISETGCWEFGGGRNKDGYGRIYIQNYASWEFQAHRVAYAFHHGRDPVRKLVCHTCDNPPCINPEHLFLGEVLDNVADMHQKSRASPQVGSGNANSRITEEVVLEIVGQIRAGLNNMEIAQTLPVSHSQVSRIRRGKAWAHVLAAANYKPGVL